MFEDTAIVSKIQIWRSYDEDLKTKLSWSGEQVWMVLLKTHMECAPCEGAVWWGAEDGGKLLVVRVRWSGCYFGLDQEGLGGREATEPEFSQANSQGPVLQPVLQHKLQHLF